MVLAQVPDNDSSIFPLRFNGTGILTYNTLKATTETCSNDLFYIWSATCTGQLRVTACTQYQGTGLVPTYRVQSRFSASLPRNFLFSSLLLFSSTFHISSPSISRASPSLLIPLHLTNSRRKW